MHNRDMIWKTADGRKLKIKDITTKHLCNIEKHINKNIDIFISKFGEKLTQECKHTIEQEIRFRKLNTIEISQSESELF